MQRILLVEDDAAIVRALEQYLSAEGFEPIAVPGQQKAMEALQSKKIDLLLLDVSLSDGDGFAVCKSPHNEKAKYSLSTPWTK